MNKPAIHTSHINVVLRLRHAELNLHDIISMIEASQNCIDVARQLDAVEKAVTHAKQAVIHDHIDHCLDARAGMSREAAEEVLSEFKEISRYL
ncbi:metal-sensing transcriptional repressor [Paraburkholderia humisilvae]|uniref:Copper-sensing transcriptional repressor CsoR n=1 Tax=Paraburkholderia humisilvae TaxID=627669 RepID=A0A6J5D549_9BURK|nr:metal-sensing transcriptional repressor [Paraburkholderia humisilvae]CAB3748444.1 hypothetical protein LMG29542_00665 [Paraburkholderia humisilvae]